MIDELRQNADKTLLYVDDTPAMVDVIVAMLEQLGHKVVGFTDPEAALAAIRDGSIAPALVLADRSMPKLDGLRLFEELHEFDPELPFVLLTGLLDESLVPQFMESGISAVLGKPISLSELSICVDGILNTVA